jgi:hypothetical protein
MSHGDRPGPESAETSSPAWRLIAEPLSTNSPTTTQPTGTTSGGVSYTSHRDSTLHTIPTPEDGRLRILKDLEQHVESFRKEEVSKTTALASILRVLGENSDVEVTQSQKESTFDSYLTEILAIQSARDHSRVPANPDDEPAQPFDVPAPGHKPRGRSFRESGVESDSDDGDDKPSKKPKLLESDMPWFIPSEEAIVSHSNPSCQATCRLLRAYNQDISKAKFFVKIATNAPSGIPSSQWERILRGDSIDLNQIFASLHHVVPDEERTGRLGDAEISFGVAEPKRRISTAAEWSSSWRRACKAITFAFPHRREELLEYGDYLESEFAAKVTSSHHKLLLYDTALRNEVAAGQQVLLTDHHRFSRLYSAIVMPDGIEGTSDHSSGKKPPKPRGGDKPEICNKFNSGTCKNSDSECKYRHLCKTCGKSGHGKKDCTDGSK